MVPSLLGYLLLFLGHLRLLLLEAPEASEVGEVQPDRGVRRQLVLQQVMQVLLVFVPTQRLLLYLIDLVDPEAVVRLPVAVLLSLLSPGHIDFPCRLRVLGVLCVHLVR